MMSYFARSSFQCTPILICIQVYFAQMSRVTKEADVHTVPDQRMQDKFLLLPSKQCSAQAMPFHYNDLCTSGAFSGVNSASCNMFAEMLKPSTALTGRQPSLYGRRSSPSRKLLIRYFACIDESALTEEDLDPIHTNQLRHWIL